MTSQEILNFLRDIDSYLKLVPSDQKESIYFEILIAKAVAAIFKIDYFCSDHDDVAIPYRVVWNGTSRYPMEVEHDMCDASARCHNFYLTIEATLKTDANQWTQEYASSVRHLRFFMRTVGCSTKQSYILFVAKEISEDTFNSLKKHPETDCKFIPINLPSFAEILATTEMAYTIKHLDIRQLFFEIPKIIEISTDVQDFRIKLYNHVINWKKEVFNKEANAIVGIKSYEVMRKINRTLIGESEILEQLSQADDITEFLSIIGKNIDAQMVEESLVNQALIAGKTQTYDIEGEIMYQPVPYFAYKDRQCRIIKTIKAINEESVQQT
jgi:hypothetical protein